MLESEIRDLLRTLAAELCATAAAVEHEPLEAAGVGERAETPLGNGAVLVAYFDKPVGDDSDRAAAMEQAARLLRACGRRWNASQIPAVSIGHAEPPRERHLARITDYLVALANTQHATNALITLRGKTLASARELEEMQRERISFTLRRLDAEAARTDGTSHAEIATDDCYAVSFWYGAALIAYFDAPYSIDFVRHRARLVTREVSAILGELSDPPPAPAIIAPLPER